MAEKKRIEITKEACGMSVGTVKEVKLIIANNLIDRGIAKETKKSLSVKSSSPASQKDSGKKKNHCKDCKEGKPCEDCEKSAQTTNKPKRGKSNTASTKKK